MKGKKTIWICRQLKYRQCRIRSEICISLEIILNDIKCIPVSLSTQILILTIAPPLSFISASILPEFAMLPDVYILLSPQEKKEVHSSSWGNRCTQIATHSSKQFNPFSVILLVCLGNTQKNKTAGQTASSLFVLV